MPRVDPDPVDDPTGSIGQKVTRSYVVGVLRLVLGHALAAAVLVILTRSLAPSEFALYPIIAISVQTGYFLIAAPLTTVLTRRREAPGRRELDSATIRVTAFATCGAAALAATAFATDAIPASLALAVVIYAFCLGSSFAPYTLLYRNVRAAALSVLDLLERTSFQIATAALVIAGWQLADALAVALLVAGLVFVVAARRMWPWRIRFADPRLTRGVAREARAPFAALLTTSALEAGLIPVVALAASSHEAGLLGWSWSIASLPVGLVMTAVIILQPALSRVPDDGVADAARRSWRLVVAVGAVSAGTLGALLPLLTEPVFGSTWSEALPIALLLLGAAVLHGAAQPLVSWWNARGSLRTIAVWQSVVNIAMLAVGGLLALQFGAIGAAVGIAGGRAIFAVVVLTSASRRLGPGFRRSASIILLGAVVALAAAYGLHTSEAIRAVVGVAVVLASVMLVDRGAVLRDLELAMKLARGPAATNAAGRLD